jgi:hypothetical protein
MRTKCGEPEIKQATKRFVHILLDSFDQKEHNKNHNAVVRPEGCPALSHPTIGRTFLGGQRLCMRHGAGLPLRRSP